MAWTGIWADEKFLSMVGKLDDDGKVIVQGEICRQLNRREREGPHVDPLVKAKREIAIFNSTGSKGTGSVITFPDDQEK